MEGLYERLRRSRWVQSLESYRSEGGFEELQRLVHKNPRDLYDFYGDKTKASEGTGELGGLAIDRQVDVPQFLDSPEPGTATRLLARTRSIRLGDLLG